MDDNTLSKIMRAFEFYDMGLNKEEAMRAARLVVDRGFTKEEAFKVVTYDRSWDGD